jgi:multicomponent Na+:H+ antiporter subunit D
MGEQLIPWLLITPLLGGGVALVGKLARRIERITCIVATLSIAALVPLLILSLGSVWQGGALRYALGGWPEPQGIILVLDGFAWVVLALVVVISLCVATFSLGDSRYGASFFFFLLLLISGMIGVCITGDLFSMFVCFEIVAIAAYVLIAYEETPSALVASFKYLILSSLGIIFFLFGIFLLYRDFGFLSIAELSTAFQQAGGVRGSLASHLALVSLCVGIGVRTAFIPFHTWLPEAHAYAPHPISALLSGALIKVSFFAMVRILLQFGGEYLFEFLTWVGALTAITAVISALAQSDAKRLLAYHSISQMGYVLAVFGAGTSLALSGAFFHAINHGLFKSLLFLTVGTAVQISGERNLYHMRPLGREKPLMALLFFVGALSISGMVPFNGYVSKTVISEGMKGHMAYPLLWITGFATIASFIKLSRIFFPAPVEAPYRPAAEERGSALLKMLPLILLAVLCLITGLYGGTVIEALHRLASAAPLPKTPVLFSVRKTALLLPAVGVGALIFGAISTKPGKAFAVRVRSLMPDLRTVLLLFFIGLICFSAVGVFQRVAF